MTASRNRLPGLAIGVLVSGFLLGAGWWRSQHPDIDRPLEVDELITLRYYTWAGIGPSGEPRILHHASQFTGLPAPTPLQLAAGLYCSVGRWPEPNNHILNSLLIDASLVAAGRSERAVRLPALLGGLAFAWAMYVLCGPILGWRWAAPLVAFWAWWHPYVGQYALTARGYTWMLALQVVLVILAYRLARTRRPLLLGVLCAFAAILSILNVVSMAADWILPFYLSLLLIRPGCPEGHPEERAGWRRMVLGQALAVFGMGAIFLASHLAAVYSSARQYGEPFDSPAAFFEIAARIFRELAPGPLDQMLALLGMAGLAGLLFARDQDRFLRLLVSSTVGLSLLHYLLSGRFPYARAAGHLIPLVLIGAAYLTESLIRLYSQRSARIAMAAMLAALTGFLAAATRDQTLRIPGLSERLELARAAEVPPDVNVFLPIRVALDSIVRFYWPSGCVVGDVVSPGDELRIITFDVAPSGGGAGAAVPVLDLRQTSGRVIPMAASTIAAGDWIFWYPDFFRLGIDASEQRSFVEKSGCPFLPQHGRFFAKLDVYSISKCFVFLPADQEESMRCEAVVEEAIRRFGGSALVFKPAGRPPDPS